MAVGVAEKAAEVTALEQYTAQAITLLLCAAAPHIEAGGDQDQYKKAMAVISALEERQLHQQPSVDSCPRCKVSLAYVFCRTTTDSGSEDRCVSCARAKPNDGSNVSLLRCAAISDWDSAKLLLARVHAALPGALLGTPDLEEVGRPAEAACLHPL